MNRFSRNALFALLAVAVMVVPAFAGTTFVNHGPAAGNGSAPYVAAFEGLGAAQNATLLGPGGILPSAAGNFALSYQLGQNLASGNLLQVEFSGSAAFNGAKILVCSQNGGAGTGNAQLGAATPASNSLSQNFQVEIPITASAAAGNFVWLTDAAACNGVGAANFPIRVAQATAIGNSTVTMAIVTAGGIPVDASSQRTILNVVNQYTVSFSTGDAIGIDFLGTPGDGTHLTAGAGNLVAGTTGKVIIAIAAVNMATGANAVGNNVARGLTVGAAVSLSDSQNWQGVKQAFLMNAAACVNGGAGNIVSSTSPPPSGIVTLAIPAAAWNGGAAGNFSVCVEVNGTTNLTSRVISSTADISVSAGGNDPAASANTTVQTWTPNGYQGTVPYLTTAVSYQTICIVNNASLNNGTIFVDVLSDEGANLTGLTNLTIGAITSKQTRRVDFNVFDIKLDGVKVKDVSAIGAEKRYSAMFTVTANPVNVTINCIQNDPGLGGKRAVPTLTGATAVPANDAWKQ